VALPRGDSMALETKRERGDSEGAYPSQSGAGRGDEPV
jgi:hypothetical protein